MLITWPLCLSSIPGKNARVRAMRPSTFVLSIVSTSVISRFCAGPNPRASPALLTRTSTSLNSRGKEVGKAAILSKSVTDMHSVWTFKPGYSFSKLAFSESSLAWRLPIKINFDPYKCVYHRQCDWVQSFENELTYRFSKAPSYGFAKTCSCAYEKCKSRR